MNTKLETDLMTPIRNYTDEVSILWRAHYHETTEVVTENIVKLNECLTKKQKIEYQCTWWYRVDETFIIKQCYYLKNASKRLTLKDT